MDIEVIKKLRADPWFFATSMVRTLDEDDPLQSVKSFKNDSYIRLFYKVLQKHNRVAVPKSRQMFFSWATIVYLLHQTMFFSGKRTGFISKKEEDAAALIKRIKFVLENLDYSVIPKELIPVWEPKHCLIEFPEINSSIRGVPQGEDQIRGYTYSNILADESSFWEKAEETYSATIPALGANGKLIMLSSPAPGFFQKIVFDELDDTVSQDDGFKQIPRFPIPGIETWINPKNKFFVFQAHYSADPIKSDPKYIENIKANMPISKFKMEYELSWQSQEGSPVYPDFQKPLHVAKEPLAAEIGLPLFVGIDFGLTPAAIICQLQGETLHVLKEVTRVNMGARRFAEVLKGELRNTFPSWHDMKRDIIMFVDPAGFQRSQTEETTCAKILFDAGFKPTPGSNIWEERRQSVEHFLLRMTKKGPSLVIDGGDCPMLCQGFDGGYAYPAKALEIEPAKIRPVKNQFSHVHDAFQYVCYGLIRLRTKNSVKIPGPGYAWGNSARGPSTEQRIL
jgi:hypothetical protein